MNILLRMIPPLQSFHLQDNTDYGSMIGGLIFLAIVIAIGYKLYSKDKIPFIKKGKIPYISKKTES